MIEGHPWLLRPSRQLLIRFWQASRRHIPLGITWATYVYLSGLSFKVKAMNAVFKFEEYEAVS
jgi:hypothetical protein